MPQLFYLLVLLLPVSLPLALARWLWLAPLRARLDADPPSAMRRWLWVALSDLYLDTDPSLFDEELRTAILGSGLPVSEVEAILELEVGPVVGPNLFDVAGEWSGFDETWLLREIARLKTRRALRFLHFFAASPTAFVARASLREMLTRLGPSR
ncbi:MAG: hypothetical protein AAGH15_18375 [Myxococcota bacterium]